MSNLFKSKFLLGVMIALVAVVGVVALKPTAEVAAANCSITATLRLGSKGAQVQCLQTALGLTADGSFGPKTQAAVIAFQKNAGLTADGVFGAKSRAQWMANNGVGAVSFLPPGCTSASGFSSVTGGACYAVYPSTLPAGCTSTSGYSSTTGALCATGQTTSLPAGCTSTSGFSSTTGASCATGVVNSNPSGPLSVSLSTDTPASGYIIGGQATADLAHFVFSGSGTLNSVTLQRTGISDQNTLTNVYLFNGNTRLTDGYSFNNTGSIVMNGLNIAVNGSMVISVKADVAASTTGNTINASTLGITLTSFTAGTTVVSANVAGNQMYYGTGSLAKTYLGTQTVTGSPTVNTGTTQFTVWSAPLQVNTRAIYLKGANFRITGSAPANSLANVNMYIDGVSAGKVATMGSITGSNYAMFDFSAAPISLSTGSHTIDLRADVVGGASYTVQVAVEQASDLTLFDPQVGVNLASLGAAGAVFTASSAASITINQGSASVVIDPTFNSMTNVTGGATNVDIAKFQVTGYGEDVKVQTLSVTPTLAGTPTLTGGYTCASGTEGTCSLNNVSVYLNGAQVGSSTTGTSGTAIQFNLGSQMIIPAGIVSTIEIRADLQNSSGFNYISGTVAATLNALTGNAQGQSSHNSITLPASAIVGNTLTIQTGLLAVSKNTNYASQSIGPNSAVKIGSYVLQNQSTSEAVRVTSLLLGLTRADGSTALTSTASTGSGAAYYPATTNFSSLYVSINGTNTTPIQPSGSNTFSINSLTIAPGATQQIDVYANTSATNDGSEFATNLVVTAIGNSSNVSVSQNGTGTAVVGQIMTLASGTITPSGTGAPSLLSANSTAMQFVPAGNGATNATKATFKINATGGSATISELKFSVNSGDASAAWVSGTTTASDTAHTDDIVATGSGVKFKVGDVVQLVNATSNGLATVTAVNTDTLSLHVTVAPGGTPTAVRLVPGTVTSITVNGVSAPVVNGLADVTNLSILVPNGGGGLTQDVYVSYAPVGVSGTQTGSTSRIALDFIKYSSGGGTTTIGTVFAGVSPATMTAVPAPTMKLVGSVPSIVVASPSTTLTTGSVEVADITVTANAGGDITLNSLPISVAMTNATLTNGNPGYNVNGIVVKDSSGNPVTTTNSVLTSTGGTGTIYFGTCVTIDCNTNAGYPISKGTSQTFKIFLNFATVANTQGAHTSSATLSLGTAYTSSTQGLGWVDTGGNASTTTGTDTFGSAGTTTSNYYEYGTTTPGFYYSYPSNTANVQS